MKWPSGNNNRENAYLFRDTLRTMIRADDLPYSELIAREAAAN